MWYVAETYSGKERAAIERLDDMGVYAYFPTYVHHFPHRRYDGVMVPRTVPLFPGYLFLQSAPSYVEGDIDIANVCRLREILQVLGDDDGKPYGIADAVVQEIRAYCEAPAPEEEKPSGWSIGDMARLSFAGWAGLVKIVKLRRAARLVEIIVPQFGNKPVTVPVHLLATV